MTLITIYHNESTNRFWKYEPGDQVSPVFQFDAHRLARWQDPVSRVFRVPPRHPESTLEGCFEEFNIGEGELAQEYRSYELRSLSVGDLVAIDTDVYVVASFGFEPLPSEALPLNVSA
jgi:hypothetical protein